MSANCVADTLFVGDWQDAQQFEGERLCVLEGDVSYPGMTYKIPILLSTIESVKRGQPFFASRTQLDTCAKLITRVLGRGGRLLVHCAAGMERSPLTCAYWLRKSGRHASLAAAYAHLMLIRPIVADRTSWLEPGEVL